jgi:hypothetical protein
MAYFTFDPKSARDRWLFRTGIAMPISLVLGAVARFAIPHSLLFIYPLAASAVFMILTFELCYPGYAATLAFLLAPFAFAVFDVYQNREAWRTWQFWFATMLCEGIGGCALICLMRKFDKRGQFWNAEPTMGPDVFVRHVSCGARAAPSFARTISTLGRKVVHVSP